MQEDLALLHNHTPSHSPRRRPNQSTYQESITSQLRSATHQIPTLPLRTTNGVQRALRKLHSLIKINGEVTVCDI